METIKELLNITLDLIKETKYLEKSLSNEFTNNCVEDTYIMGFNFYSIPLNNLIDNIDNYLDKFEDFEKYEYAGKNINYIIYERDVFEDNKTKLHKEAAITYQDGRKYYINNKDDAIFYLINEVIPTFINNILSEKDNVFAKEEIEKNISIEIMNLLLIFHKETLEYVNEFNHFLNKFTNGDVDITNSEIIKNLEKNIEDKLFLLNKNIFEDALFQWIYEKKYGDNITTPPYSSSIHEKNIIDFCRWFLQKG